MFDDKFRLVQTEYYRIQNQIFFKNFTQSILNPMTEKPGHWYMTAQTENYHDVITCHLSLSS